MSQRAASQAERRSAARLERVERGAHPGEMQPRHRERVLEPEPVERLAVLGSERFRIAEREPAQESRAAAAAVRERRGDPRADPVQLRARPGRGCARGRERGMRQRAADGDPRAPEPPQRIAVAGIARPAQRREPQPRAQPIAGQPRVEVARLRREHAHARDACAAHRAELDPARRERRPSAARPRPRRPPRAVRPRSRRAPPRAAPPARGSRPRARPSTAAHARKRRASASSEARGRGQRGPASPAHRSRPRARSRAPCPRPASPPGRHLGDRVRER